MSIVKNLNYKEDNFQIQIAKWQMEDEGITALVGPSGSGKSTILKILMGLIESPGMSWVFRGDDLTKLPVEQRRLGVVFQSLDIFPHMTAKENILFAAECRKVPAKEAQEKLNYFVEKLKLQSCLNTKGVVLSGGEKQRVALARALIGQPRLLLLDEAFSALDSGLRGEARKLVKSILAELQIPAIIVTHDEQDVIELGANKVLVEDIIN